MAVTPFAYRGQRCRIRTVLHYPIDIFPDNRVPGDLKHLLGLLIEKLNAAFAPDHAMIMVHIPVKHDHVWETVHLDLEYQIDLWNPDANGWIRLNKYAGPFEWGQEDWSKTTLAFTGLDLV